MKARSSELAAHMALSTRTIARCWRIERRDGYVLTVNSSDINFTFSGELYEARGGVNPTAISQNANASVQNSEMSGFMDSAGGVIETEIYAGLWDGAFVTIFEVNYNDLTMGRMILQTGTIGNVQAGRMTFNAEVRGLAQALQQTVGEVYTKNCMANLGDARCKVPLGPLTVTGSITAVTTRRSFTDTTRAEAADYFGAGVITFTSGLNDDVSMEIAEFSAGVFSLMLPMPFNVVIGDTYSLIPGCRKRAIEDCKNKYNNILNNRGFPYVPGGDKMLGLGGTEGTQL